LCFTTRVAFPFLDWTQTALYQFSLYRLFYLHFDRWLQNLHYMIKQLCSKVQTSLKIISSSLIKKSINMKWLRFWLHMYPGRQEQDNLSAAFLLVSPAISTNAFLLVSPAISTETKQSKSTDLISGLHFSCTTWTTPELYFDK